VPNPADIGVSKIREFTSSGTTRRLYHAPFVLSSVFEDFSRGAGPSPNFFAQGPPFIIMIYKYLTISAIFSAFSYLLSAHLVLQYNLVFTESL
jgi:hypothetical protein